MTTTRREFLTAALAAAGGLVIASCAPSTTTQPTPGAAGASAAAGTSTATGPSAATSAATKRGSLIYGASREVTELEPFHNTGNTNVQVYNCLYDTVTGRDKNFKLVPKLAQSWKLLNDTTWEFKLRPGVKFHNGEPLTAADIKFTMEYIADPAAKTVFATTFATVDKVEIVDDLTLRITTKGPDILLPDRFSIRPGYVLPKSYFQKVGGYDGFNKAPVGTGPYKFKEATAGVKLTLVANQDYWDKVPNADSVTFLPRPDLNARIAALKTGEVNYIDSVDFSQVEELKKASNVKIAAVNGLGITMYVVNATVKPLDNKLIRQAMSLAVDRPTLVKTLFGGTQTVANGPLLGIDFAYDPKAPPLPYDPEKAKALIKQAGYAREKITLEYVVGGLTTGSDLLDVAVAEAWKAVGLNIDLQPLDAATRARKLSAKQFAGVFQATFRSYYADPDGVIWRTLGPGGSLRYWTNPDFDKLGAAAAVSADQDLRLRNYQQMVKIMLEEMPFISLFEEVRVYATGANVEWQPGANGLTDDFNADRLTFK